MVSWWLNGNRAGVFKILNMDNKTVKDKAKYLIRKFGKEYAINVVDEIIEELIEIEELVIDEVDLPFKYWHNVKNEINLL